jgi:hypothetical protein
VRRLGYQYVLLGVLVVYLLIIVVRVEYAGGPVRVAVLGLLLLASVRTGRAADRWAMPSLVIVVLAVAATLVAAVAGNMTVVTCVSQASTAVLGVAAIVMLAQTLLAAGVIDGRAIGGLLCIYLLLGLLFSALHGFAGALISDYLKGVNGHPTQSETLYFSLITLTTVGFGDITPTANLARAIASTEALVGQLYLVSVVAAAVSRYQPRRVRSTGSKDTDTSASGSGAPHSGTSDPGEPAGGKR